MSVQDKITSAAKEFEEDLGQISFLNKLEEQTNIPKSAIFLGAALVAAIAVMGSFGPGLLCNLTGFIYPSYASFKAIESVGKDDDTQWLTYWVVYAAFNIVETFTDAIVFWLPFYYPFKFGFLIWCFLPNTRGAQFVYDNIVQPFLLKQESRIDRALSDAKERVGSIVEDIMDNSDDEGTDNESRKSLKSE